jgi:hypothetical protein
MYQFRQQGIARLLSYVCPNRWRLTFLTIAFKTMHHEQCYYRAVVIQPEVKTGTRANRINVNYVSCFEQISYPVFNIRVVSFDVLLCGICTSINSVINTMAAQIANFTRVCRFPPSEYKEHIITALYFRSTDLEASIRGCHYGNSHCAVVPHVPVVNIYFLRGQTRG